MMDRGDLVLYTMLDFFKQGLECLKIFLFASRKV